MKTTAIALMVLLTAQAVSAQSASGTSVSCSVQVTRPIVRSAAVPSLGDTARETVALRLNLPSFGLELYEGARLVHTYAVAIGDTAFPTPEGSFEVTRVDWDPWWVPPASAWADKDTMMAPGPTNPMGRVRLAFRDLYFIHGTPQPRLVGLPVSHGCVRLYDTDAVDLARRVLLYGAPGLPAPEIQKLAAQRGKTRSIELERPVRFEIRYEIAAVKDGKLVLYRDIYHRVAREMVLDSVLGVIRRSMGDSVAIDTARARWAVERAKGKRLSIDIKRLLRGAPW